VRVSEGWAVCQKVSEIKRGLRWRMPETLPRVARLIGPDSIIWPPKARRGRRCLNRWRPTGNSGRQGRCGCGDTIRIGEAKKGQETVRGTVSPTMDATARLHFCAVAVIVTVALKYACPPLAESGGAGVVQARAPAQLPEGCAAIRHWFGDARARPDLALLAQIAVSRHSGHLPLNRQAVVMARHRVAIGRSTLADRMGRTGCGDRAR